LLTAVRDVMFSMTASILGSCVLMGELLVLRPKTTSARLGLPGRLLRVHYLGC
jgi:hypothetical protein